MLTWNYHNNAMCKQRQTDRRRYTSFLCVRWPPTPFRRKKHTASIGLEDPARGASCLAPSQHHPSPSLLSTNHTGLFPTSTCQALFHLWRGTWSIIFLKCSSWRSLSMAGSFSFSQYLLKCHLLRLRHSCWLHSSQPPLVIPSLSLSPQCLFPS